MFLKIKHPLRLEDAQRISADAGLNLRQISFENIATNNWHNILVEADREDRVHVLLDRALEEYPTNQDLTDICKAYHHFKASGGSFGSLTIISERNIEVSPGDFVSPTYLPLNYHNDVADILTFYTTNIFIGREAEWQRITSLVTQQESSYLLIEALSGYGKIGISCLPD